MAKKIEKAYAISNARISYVSLVDKAANKHKFLLTKAENGAANFTSTGRIVKTDSDSHYVTGIVYEPMTEDTDGNYMTEAEITKAAHWFMKNDGDVDVQHCFKKAKGVEVVESYVAKADMEIEGQNITKGTWLMTMEVTDGDTWEAIEKGRITGFSMGGVGEYSDEDVELEDVEKADEPKGLLKKLAKALGMDVVEKGKVKDTFERRIKSDNFFTVWGCLRDALEGNFYNAEKGMWEWGLTSDEAVIAESLTEFNEIVTGILTSGNVSKSLKTHLEKAEKPIRKEGKSLSKKNLDALTSIRDTLNTFLSDYEDDNPGEGSSTNKTVKKEVEEMTAEEVAKMVEDAVEKAVSPIAEQVEAVVKAEEDGGTAQTDDKKKKKKDDEDVTAEEVAKMIGNAVEKAVKPMQEAIEPLLKSRALPGNLNDSGDGDQIEKGEEHYLHGIL